MPTKLIPPPPPTVPIGTVSRDGRVIISQDWALYLTVGLLQRVGGYNGMTPAELQAEIEAVAADVEEALDAISDVAFAPRSDNDQALRDMSSFMASIPPQQPQVEPSDADSQIASLRAEVDRLRMIVEGLTVGTVI